ncbi:hypothetical protein CRYUN_Cryun17cG0043100 [Craigia yunnanensis]
MGTSHRVEAVDDKEGDGSSKHLTDFEVKPLSRHGSSASSSSSDSSQDLVNVHGNNDNDDNKPLEKSEQPELKLSTPFRVSFVSSNEQSPDNHMPAGQVPGGYVPNRIPSSIFSSKPATPTDWSTASNESLFSIHVGNGSFSKDQFFMLYKSGELTKLDEQIIAQGNLLPPLKELEDMAARNENIEKGSGATEMSNNTKILVVETNEVAEDHSHQKRPRAEEVHNPVINTPTVDLGAVAGNHSQEKKFPAEVHNSPTNSISGLSDDSNNSTLSFAFPVLTGTDAGRFSSVNGDQNNKGLQTQSVKQQQQEQKQSTAELQPQTPVTPQNASSRSWFSWFYCCRYS